eukprot:CAMPEP_0178431384 /NCGR_PEP_ID=MMETSP0689_2-20121128/31818_1 /TAXON_ID=160604 /ORGANISM="Amphidinium massartii, Strain CS-259" /LENGTH=610 /DNA_ID=CAMNT_0020053291 /DNA_START=101 /DNA_END=1933 /DNA_ORIENTATION=+
MGVLRQLAFWKKPKKASTPVKPFADADSTATSTASTAEPTRTAEVTEPLFEEAANAESGNCSPVWEGQAGKSEVEPASPSVKSLGSLSAIEDVPQSGAQEVVHHAEGHAASPARLQQQQEAAPATERPRFEAIEASSPREMPVPTGLAESLSPPSILPTQTGRAATPEGDFVVDVPAKEVFASISEAFGPMIAQSVQSSKWDQRAQALKSMGAVLKGLDLQGMAKPGSTGAIGTGLKLRDRVRCWRSCCQLLNMVMKDKVMPVRLASYDLFMDAFVNVAGVLSEEDLQLSLDTLVPHLVERLGDSNLRLHESARKCVLFCAEEEGLLGLGGVLQRLRSQLDAKQKAGDRAKALFGILDTVNFLVRHFPGHRSDRDSVVIQEEDDDEAYSPSTSWTQDDVLPFVTAGMNDSNGPRIRNCAVQLAVTVYATFGMEAVESMLGSMRPAIQALLRQKFKEYEEDDLEEFSAGPIRSSAIRPTGDAMLDGLVVCGQAVQPPKVARQPSLPGGIAEEDEECIMDTILEDAGMVFGASNIVPKDGRVKNHHHSFHVGFDLEHEQLSVFEMSEEHRVLEEELLGLGFDLEALGEEQEVLMNCRPQSDLTRPARPMEVF